MLVKKLSVNVNSQVQHDFKEAVKQKHDRIKGFYGSEIENIMKLYLTINGASDYSDDPDVKEMIESIRGDSPCTHTHHHDSNDGDLDTNLDDEEYLDAKFYKAVDKRFDEFERNMKKAIKENIKQGIRAELENTYTYSPTNKTNPMDVYMAAFIKEYGEWNQVSYGELSSLAVQVHGVSDKRSITNRINYLVGKGVIKEFSPNVYNVIH